MNLGTLSTMARYAPPNLTHVVFDNESLLSVGGFPSATGTGTDLAGIAREAGVEFVEKPTRLKPWKKPMPPPPAATAYRSSTPKSNP